MKEIEFVLQKVTKSLLTIPGIRAIVLGGSRARGNAAPDSDIDIGIYYDGMSLDLEALTAAAMSVDDEHSSNLIYPPGEWGVWVNGGGWLTINGYSVDFLLRDISRVEKIITESENGHVDAHYQTGHPHAYLNVMYRGELAISRMLWDKDGRVSVLKSIAEKYPPAMKQTLIAFFSFEANFSLAFAEKNAEKGDAYYVTAHIVRSVSSLNQVLFAINEEYCINEKKAVRLINGFTHKPKDYQSRIDAIFTLAGENNREACAILQSLLQETAALADIS